MCHTGICKYSSLMGECLLKFKGDGVIIPKDADCFKMVTPPLWRVENSNKPLNSDPQGLNDR